MAFRRWFSSGSCTERRCGLHLFLLEDSISSFQLFITVLLRTKVLMRLKGAGGANLDCTYLPFEMGRRNNLEGQKEKIQPRRLIKGI